MITAKERKYIADMLHAIRHCADFQSISLNYETMDGEQRRALERLEGAFLDAWLAFKEENL